MENKEFDKTLELAVADKIQDALHKVAERKKVLAELTPNAEKSSVEDRLKQFANRPDEQAHPDKEKEKNKPLGLDGLAKRYEKLDEKSKKAGIDISRPTSAKEKDDKDKAKEKTKEQKREEVKQQQEEKLKKFENIPLPNGLRIKQEAGQWKLYNKDNKSVDITNEVESIIKQNGKINEANEQIDKQNDMMDSSKIPTDNKAISNDDKVNIVSAVLSNDEVKKEMFKELAPEVNEDTIKKVSENVIDYAETKRLFEMLDNPNQAERALKELEDKDKQNKNRLQKEIPIKSSGREGY